MKKSFWKIIFYAFTLIMIFRFIYYFRLRLFDSPERPSASNQCQCVSRRNAPITSHLLKPGGIIPFRMVTVCRNSFISFEWRMDVNWNNFTFPSSTSQRASNHHIPQSLVSWSAKWDVYMYTKWIEPTSWTVISSYFMADFYCLEVVLFLLILKVIFTVASNTSFPLIFIYLS